MVRKQIIQQSETIQEEIPAEVVRKFDGDKELVEQFLAEGNTIEELERSTVLHATKFDPLVIVDGNTIGMWLNGGKKYIDNSKTYQNRSNKFF